jgi:16S rRNA (guanine(1405)-N(7))-methyltransferase
VTRKTKSSNASSPFDPAVQPLIRAVLNSRKYRDLGIPPETVRDLLEKELALGRNEKAALKAVRQKLHNVMAPYLGDPDYEQAAVDLELALAADEMDGVRAVCTHILQAHASTRERQPLLEAFYPRLFAVTGQPQTVLDVACGLHPFGLPWMGLPPETHYHAYDIHRPRVDLINRFLTLLGMAPLAELRDVLVQPPEVQADVAFFFKEAHRFEQRQRGCNRPFWQALKVHWLLVSLPVVSLSGQHSLLEGSRALVRSVLGDLPWRVEEILFENEVVFAIEKPL